ncbi:DUF805 domain-containing protein [Psychrobacter phenylpyruvicus]|uniref:Inner membrane protein yhaH n=1 Tax=Psychrobacter phenylpyruvicus TaxID=29432 RepID=A0A379LIQ3_9GAMM|nr:DUF805 domain-containing protein [Psychrobacter phenylpyruvicus]SUD89965.1 Inner membrane protein yhaH [Psychrobacter phenylpyruvicus]
MDWFVDAIKNKYAQFDGRARRKEYWMFQLFYWLFYLVFFMILGLLTGLGDSESITTLGAMIIFIFMLGLIIPMWAVTIRRLHDTGKSGWWALITFIPYIGPIVLLIFCCLDSEPGMNKYGPNPKGIES